MNKEFMELFKTRVRLISITLTCLILFNSCRVYHKENVTLNVAVEEQRRVKLTTLDGQKLKFKRIILKDSQFYGVKKIKKENTYIPIKIDNIKSLRLHNRTMSVIYGVIIGAVIFMFVGTLLYIAAWDGIGFGGTIMAPI